MKVFGYINAATNLRYKRENKFFIIRFYVYYLPHWPHDSNTDIFFLYRYIREELMNSSRPKVLYLQFDNCCKDNKNY
jgi:hypothetical protein